jgi:hypothetical protein
MSGAKGPNTKKEKTDGMIKEWEEGVQHMRQDAHETQDARKERTIKIRLPFITWCYHAPIMKVTS